MCLNYDAKQKHFNWTRLHEMIDFIPKWMRMHALNTLELSAGRNKYCNEISKNLTKHIERRKIEIISIFNNWQFHRRQKLSSFMWKHLYKTYKVAKQNVYDIWRMTDIEENCSKTVKISFFLVCVNAKENLNYYYKSLSKSVTNKNRNFAISKHERSSQVPGVQKSIQWINTDFISHPK